MPEVDKEKCIGCGTCVAMCPDCFKMDDEGKAESTCKGSDCQCNCNLEEVISACPTSAISE